MEEVINIVKLSSVEKLKWELGDKLLVKIDAEKNRLTVEPITGKGRS